MQRHGFDSPLSFQWSGFFPLELAWVLTLFPIRWEYIHRGLVCAHMHSIAQTKRILTFMSQTSECRQQKHTQHAPSMKTECDYLYGWLKKWSHMQKSHQRWWTPEIKLVTQKKKKNFHAQNNICNTCWHIEGSGPEWCISSMLYSEDTPFWPGTLDLKTQFWWLSTNCQIVGVSRYFLPLQWLMGLIIWCTLY